MSQVSRDMCLIFGGAAGAAEGHAAFAVEPVLAQASIGLVHAPVASRYQRGLVAEAARGTMAGPLNRHPQLATRGELDRPNRCG